ncbi:unnamed protein product [Polarella glacialis]|uniref:J domain-containing protein n=1 Tax=Polarella glacialis TaxID=89957 RepID=A0A813JZX7_POLGL|nr:unnamed protein product [Polarella glacialis]
MDDMSLEGRNAESVPVELFRGEKPRRRGVSALDLAVARGFEEGGEVLLQHGAPLRHFQHETLVEAIDRGSMLLLRALLQQLGVYTHQGLYMTEAACEALNSAGADGNTPLHMACLLPDKEAAVKILIAHNAEMNVENDEGMTPLDCCVQTQNRAAWRALRHSAGGQAKHRHYEAEHRSLRSAVASNCLFLARNVHLRQDDEKKVGKLGADHGELLHLALATPAVSEDMVQYLVEQGADVNTLLDGFSVMRLERYVSGQGIELVFDIAAGVNHREAGCLPLHLAACRGHVDAVKVLLKANSNVHEQTDNGRTALDLACDALSMLDGADSAGEDEVFARLCRTIDALLARSCRLKEFKDESQLDRAREFVQREAGTLRKDALDQKEATKEDSGRAEARKVAKRRRDDGDEAVKAVEREVRAKVVEEEKKTDGYKESEKLAKKVAEAREVLQASWRGDGEKLPEYLSSKYYQIRIDVLRRKIQEKDQQIEEALKKMDFAEEDYLWLLRKRMRDLRLKHHPDKITDRQPTEEDYKFYERITKAYDVLCTKEERDKYLELSNHVEWLQQRGEVDEANLVEKATFWDAILADDSLPQSHRDKAPSSEGSAQHCGTVALFHFMGIIVFPTPPADLAGDGLGAASKRLCSERLGQCRDDDYPIGKTVARSAAHFLGACCPEYRRKLLSARAPSWMMREVTEDFAIWKGSWQPQISSERLDDAERRFGESLSLLGQLGTTLACREHSHGPFVIKDIAAGATWSQSAQFAGAVETLLGAGALSSDVDFLVMWDETQCQKGVALIPLNDCLGGLADELHRRILDGMEATPSPDSNQWTRDALDNRLVWRGSIRSSVTCTPPNTKPEACRCEQLDHPDNTSDLKRWARFRLLDQAHRFPDDLDARGRCASCRPGAEAPSWFASLPQQGDSHGFAWRNYLLHGSVDANAYNTLANWRPLLLGRVLVKQVAAITVSWFRHGLKPFVHYIPVREDLSDLRKQLAWARAHPNETESIRRAGFEFARKYVARCQHYSRLHLWAALEEYIKLQNGQFQ